MADYRYVTRAETKEAYDEIVSIIREVQDYVREDFTFQYRFIGSYPLNLVTYDADSNVGFDFDANLDINDPDEKFTPGELRTKIFEAFQVIAPQHGYQKVENSTSVITIKMVDYWNSTICHSCDFAVVNVYDGGEEYVKFDKDQQNYVWEERSIGYKNQPQKIDWLKENDHWNDFRDYYLMKKDANDDPNKHSRSIRAEAINEMCQKTGYPEH